MVEHSSPRDSKTGAECHHLGTARLDAPPPLATDHVGEANRSCCSKPPEGSWQLPFDSRQKWPTPRETGPNYSASGPPTPPQLHQVWKWPIPAIFLFKLKEEVPTSRPFEIGFYIRDHGVSAQVQKQCFQKQKQQQQEEEQERSQIPLGLQKKCPVAWSKVKGDAQAKPGRMGTFSYEWQQTCRVFKKRRIAL